MKAAERRARFTLTDEEAQLIVKGMTQWAKCKDQYGSGNCPLCAKFATPKDWEKDKQCVGCPVYRYTGRRECNRTPVCTALPLSIKIKRILLLGERMLDDGGYEIKEV